MKALALAAIAALTLTACAGFTVDQAECIINGLSSSDFADGLDLAKAKALAESCGVTLADVLDAFNAEAAVR
jgi:predicted xylose isomerase-like sugar epimerase